MQVFRDGKTTYDQMCDAIRTNPDTAEWYTEKGEPNDQRELRRIWDKVAAGHADLPCDPTEDAVAKVFAETYANRLVYDHTEETWYVWQFGRWTRDSRNRGFHAARLFTRAIKDKLDEPPNALANMAFCAAVERAARADPKLAVSSEVWNTDPWLLGTPDGIIDLRTGNVFAATAGHYISKYTSVSPAPPGTATPLWSAFLDAATKGDKDFQKFLQRLAGYLLTGGVSEEVLTFLYGPGGTGKGTFLNVLVAILGDYAISLPIEAFTAGSRINLEYYRARMAGARLVTASETEAQATWAESQIKDITGNERPISARHPRGRPFDFWSQAKIVIVGNHAPKLKGRSPAMERRLRVAPFANTPEAPDLALKDKLKAEYPAILRWILDGCAMWRKERLATSDAVKKATSSYFEQQDAFGRWLDECCKLDRSLSLKPGLLLASFNRWAKDNGEVQVGNNEFAEMIDRQGGLKRVKKHGVRLVEGIGLNPPPLPPDPEAADEPH